MSTITPPTPLWSAMVRDAAQTFFAEPSTRRAALATATAFSLNQLVEFFVLSQLGLAYAKLCGFDCGWYASIVETWYHVEAVSHVKMDAANWAFFPLFPGTAAAVKFVTRLPTPLALIVTSKIYFLLSIFAFVYFVRVYRPDIPEWIAAFVPALSPLSLYGNNGYAEPVFFLFSCVGFIFLARRKFVRTGAAGALMTASRLAGIFFIAAYVWCAVRDRKLAWSGDIVFGLLLIPLGLCCFALILYFANGDALAFLHVQIAWGRTFRSPYVVLRNAFFDTPRDMISGLMVVSACFGILYLMFKRRFELALFSLGCTVVPLTTGIWSMPRFLWWQVPLLLVVVEICNNRTLRIVLLPLFVGGLGFMYYVFLTNWTDML